MQSNKISNYLLQSETIQYYVIFLVVLLTYGFPMIGYISVTLGVPSTPIAIFYRFVLLVLSIFLILVGISKPPLKFTKGIYFLLFFWIIYSIRIIWDISIIDIERQDSYTPFFIYSFAFGNCLLPLVAIALATKKLDLKKLLNFALIVLFFQNLLIFSVLYKNYGINPEAFLIRQNLTGADGESNVLNAISLGRAGGVLFTLCLAYLSLFKSKFLFKILIYISMPLSLYILFAGGSRGPMVATLLTSIILCVFYLRKRKLKGYLNLSFMLVPLFIALLFGVQKANISTTDVAVIGRLEGTINQSKEEIRVTMWRGAWDQFLESPIIGYSMLESKFHFYPHNILLESLMATGVLGSFFFFGGIGLFFKRLYKSYKLRSSVTFVLGLLVFFSLVSNMTSGALYLGVDFWATLGVFLIIKI